MADYPQIDLTAWHPTGQGGKEEEVNVVKSFMGANTEIFVKTLEQVELQYGSMEAYLKGPIGLTEADVQALRHRYCTCRSPNTALRGTTCPF